MRILARIAGGFARQITDLLACYFAKRWRARKPTDCGYTNRNKNDCGILSECESSRNRDINKAKQFFDQPNLNRLPPRQSRAMVKGDPSEAYSTPVSSFPPSTPFERGQWDNSAGEDTRLEQRALQAEAPRAAQLWVMAGLGVWTQRQRAVVPGTG